jgi:hypothetical protein
MGKLPRPARPLARYVSAAERVAGVSAIAMAGDGEFAAKPSGEENGEGLPDAKPARGRRCVDTTDG